MGMEFMSKFAVKDGTSLWPSSKYCSNEFFDSVKIPFMNNLEIWYFLTKSQSSTALKIFLLSLAIIDDLGAVLIIAFFYSSDLQTVYLLYAAIFFSALIGVNVLGIQQNLVYWILGVFLWYCILKSGVHGTLAGVLLAATIPNNAQGTNETSMLKDLEQPVHHFVGLFILPLFAFFNSDINFQSLSFESFMRQWWIVNG